MKIMKTKDLKEKVYHEISKIKKGEVLTYKELAKRCENPKAIRAVATIVGKNPNPIIVPCHRVIRSDMKVGEYTYKEKKNQKMKIKLLKEEGVNIIKGKVVISKKNLN
jgi:O-6-methylguanine DNA methyltransferase